MRFYNGVRAPRFIEFVIDLMSLVGGNHTHAFFSFYIYPNHTRARAHTHTRALYDIRDPLLSALTPFLSMRVFWQTRSGAQRSIPARTQILHQQMTRNWMLL